MVKTLWGEIKTRRRKRKKGRDKKPILPYAITLEGKDCEILGHTVNFYDLAGCTTCIDCGISIFCPQCIKNHPTDPQAIPVLCPRHDESHAERDESRVSA